MSIEDRGELVALKDLLESEGWALFTQMVEKSWGPDAFARKVEQAVEGAAMGDQNAVNDLAQHVISKRKAVLAVMELPKERLRQLTAKKESFNPLRRIAR